MPRTISGEEIPFVYRTHENPDEEKIQKLSTFINNFGYSMHIAKDEVHPKELQKLLEQIEGTPEEPLISRLTPAFDETGKVYGGLYRAFWLSGKILLSFYFSDPKISGSSDPSYYQRESAWQDE